MKEIMEGSFSLTCTEFETNTANFFRDLYQEEHFTDVTIACDDGKLFKALKVVLSASSKFMEKILLEHSHPDPLLFFSDTSSEHLHSILKYIYLGEVSVAEKELDNFMKTVKRFQIKALCNYEDQNEMVWENLDQIDDDKKYSNIDTKKEAMSHLSNVKVEGLEDVKTVLVEKLGESYTV